MRVLRDVLVATAAFLLLAGSACTDETSPQATSDAAEGEQAAALEEPAPELEEIPVEDFPFDPANFGDSANVDNQWLPLRPGTRLVYDGSARDEGDRFPRSVVFTVTDLTKVVNGVRTVVGWDRD